MHEPPRPATPLPGDPAQAPVAAEPLAGSPALDGAGEADPGSIAYVEAWETQALRVAERTAAGRKQGSLQLVREVIETGILALVIFLGVRTVNQTYRVEGQSMDPTYHTGQYLFVNKGLYTRLANWLPFGGSTAAPRYLFHRPRRGDVIVFQPPPPNAQDHDFIKRVIGEPGEHVVIKDGQVHVDDRLLDETYIPNLKTVCGGQFCDVTLKANEYYVLGDNRPLSSDSRFWGPVQGDKIVGKPWLIFLPFGDFSRAPSGPPRLIDAPAADQPR